LEWFVECECGWTCRGGEDDIVAACTEHARDEHDGIELTREQVFAVAKPVEDATTWGKTSDTS
jgi:predicted small metal-binding protein